MKLYATAQLALLAALAVAGFFLWKYLKGNNPFDIARDLKTSTPLGIPARAIDAGISRATGRAETLGGWLAEVFDPTTRAASAMLASPLPRNDLSGELSAGASILPHAGIAADYSVPWDTSP